MQFYSLQPKKKKQFINVQTLKFSPLRTNEVSIRHMNHAKGKTQLPRRKISTSHNFTRNKRKPIVRNISTSYMRITNSTAIQKNNLRRHTVGEIPLLKIKGTKFTNQSLAKRRNTSVVLERPITPKKTLPMNQLTPLDDGLDFSFTDEETIASSIGTDAITELGSEYDVGSVVSEEFDNAIERSNELYESLLLEESYTEDNHPSPKAFNSDILYDIYKRFG